MLSSRRYKLPLLTLLCAALLSGCIHLPDQLAGPVAIQFEDGEFRVAVCADVLVTGIYTESLGTRQVDQFWDAETTSGGVETVKAGTVLDRLNLSEHFASVSAAREPSVFSADWVIYVVLHNDSDPSANIVVGFDPTLLPPDSENWLHPDDSLTTTPCDT